jgi:hypothetical protein
MATFQDTLDNLNTWRRYRGEVHLTQAQANQYYRVGDYVPPAPPAAVIPARPAPDLPQAVPYNAQQPQGANQEAFLSTVPLGFEIATKADPSQNANVRQCCFSHFCPCQSLVLYFPSALLLHRMQIKSKHG